MPDEVSAVDRAIFLTKKLAECEAEVLRLESYILDEIAANKELAKKLKRAKQELAKLTPKSDEELADELMDEIRTTWARSETLEKQLSSEAGRGFKLRKEVKQTEELIAATKSK